jgi:hypothetical protein
LEKVAPAALPGSDFGASDFGFSLARRAADAVCELSATAMMFLETVLWGSGSCLPLAQFGARRKRVRPSAPAAC